jgi:hypothetical protein
MGNAAAGRLCEKTATCTAGHAGERRREANLNSRSAWPKRGGVAGARRTPSPREATEVETHYTRRARLRTNPLDSCDYRAPHPRFEA